MMNCLILYCHCKSLCMKSSLKWIKTKAIITHVWEKSTWLPTMNLRGLQSSTFLKWQLHFSMWRSHWLQVWLPFHCAFCEHLKHYSLNTYHMFDIIHWLDALTGCDLEKLFFVSYTSSENETICSNFWLFFPFPFGGRKAFWNKSIMVILGSSNHLRQHLVTSLNIWPILALENGWC